MLLKSRYWSSMSLKLALLPLEMLGHALSVTTAAAPVPGVRYRLTPLARAPWHAYGSRESHSEEPLALKTPVCRAQPCQLS